MRGEGVGVGEGEGEGEGGALRTISRSYRACNWRRTVDAEREDEPGRPTEPKQRCWLASFQTIQR